MKTWSPRVFREALLSITCFTVLASFSFGAKTSRRWFDIPAGDAPATLLQFIEQSDQQLLYAPEAAQGVRTTAVRGELEPRQALDRMLRGTPLTPVAQSDGVLAINRASDPRTPRTQTAADRETPAPRDDAPARTGSSAEITRLDPYVTTGSRFTGRTVAQSPVPIDYLGREELTATGHSDFAEMLQVSVPAFNLTHQSASGATDFIRAMTLRGMVPGQALVLVNGKRRHTPAAVNTSNAVGRGTVSVDLNAIPSDAIHHVEVLRDGASAQYGSDAIAGVINVILDKSKGSGISASLGVTSEGDGLQTDFGAYSSVPLPGDGVLRATVFYREHEKTSRAKPDTRQQYFGSNGTRLPSALFGSGTGLTPANGTLDPREATFDRNVFQHGESPYEQIGGFFDSETTLANDITLYGFGGYSRLEGASDAFFRAPSNDATVRAIYPDGYRPIANVTLTDESLVLGARGSTIGRWEWDLSSGIGSNKFGFIIDRNVNPSLGTASPTTFNLGGFYFEEWSTKLDLRNELSVGLRNPLNVALGAEHRVERYNLSPGEEASYINGGVPILDGPNVGRPAPVGTQGYTAIRTVDAVREKRRSNAAYLDTEYQVNDRLLLAGAVRAEDFTDVGQNTTYKLAGRFALTDRIALRSSVNTGFRAPSLVQEWFSNTTTIFVNGAPTLNRLLPVYDPIAKLLGAVPLKPEKSDSFSAGIAYESDKLTLSVDVYRIDVEDQVILSSIFNDARIAQLVSGMGFPSVQAVSFFTNAVDSRNEGIDIAGRYRFDLHELGRLTATIASTVRSSEATRIAPTPAAMRNLGINTPLFDLSQKVRFEAGQPKYKHILNLAWERGKFSTNLRNILYGPFESVAFASLSPAAIATITQGYDVRLNPTDPASANMQVTQIFQPKIVTDLDFGWQVNRALRWSLGADNILDIYPDEHIASTPAGNGSDNGGTVTYPTLSPFGYKGTFFYTKVRYTF